MLIRVDWSLRNQVKSVFQFFSGVLIGQIILTVGLLLSVVVVALQAGVVRQELTSLPSALGLFFFKISFLAPLLLHII